MKRFQFSLEPVLGYKHQVLEARKIEHASAISAVRQQEEILCAAENRYALLNQTYRDKKAGGMTVAEAISYENSLRSLEAEIRREEERLEELNRREAEKRGLVVEARKDTSSLEKLREHKLESYRKEEQKSEEAFIDELVSATRSAVRQTAPAH